MERFNPEMLVLAREARRLTQTALAKRTGVSQGTISKIENGQLVPPPETIEALALGLEFPKTLLARDSRASTVPVTFFRKKASLSQGDAKRILATITLQRAQMETLLRSVDGLPSANVPTALPSGSRSAADLAAELRRGWRMPRGPIEDLTALFEANGIVVVPTDFGADGIEGLSIREPGLPPLMFVNALAPMDRVRFTMAHELGHLVMHHAQAIAPDDCESEADLFASEFLMPAQDIRYQLGEIDIEKLARLKTEWRVSMQSLLMRASALQRVGPARSKRLWIEMSISGYRTKEPVEIAREEPALVREMVQSHLEDLEYTPGELAAALDLSEEEFRAQYMRSRSHRHLKLVGR